MKAALCHMSCAQLRDAEVGLPVASLLATLAVCSSTVRNRRFFSPFQTKLHEGDIQQAMEGMQRTWSSFVPHHFISFWCDVNVIVCN